MDTLSGQAVSCNDSDTWEGILLPRVITVRVTLQKTRLSEIRITF